MRRGFQFLTFLGHRIRAFSLPRSTDFSRKSRRLLCEALEDRQLLSITVQSLMPTADGFVAQFSQPIETRGLNLYDAQNGALGATDVLLYGSTTGSVAGSLVVDGSKISFVSATGALAADTYTVTLRSGANAFRDAAFGELLDGEYNGTSLPSGNGTAGGDFVYSFSVAAPKSLVVSVPDFARGPNQPVNVPAQGSGVALPSGLPIRLSDAAGVTSVKLTLKYNPQLLTVTGASLGASVPAGSQFEANWTVPGEVTIAFYSLQPMTAGALDIVRLTAAVPATAEYGAAQVLSITALEVNAGAMQATADNGVHVAAFPGDTNRNGRYDAEDARLVGRVQTGLDTGFAVTPAHLPTPTSYEVLYPTINPGILGDVTGKDGLTSLDASDILRRVVSLSTPNIPDTGTTGAPISLSLSHSIVLETAVVGTLVGTLSTVDPSAGDTFTYSLVTGEGSADNASFSISGNQLKTAATLDYAAKSNYSIRVRTTDSTGLFIERMLTIQVADVNEAPTAVALSANAVAENSAVGTLIGLLSTTDEDAGNTFTYSLVSGAGSTDNASFTIDGNQLKTAAGFDYEAKASYSIRIRSTDQGGLWTERVFTVAVTNVNETPTAIAITPSAVAENQPIGTAVGLLSTTDPDTGDTFTYALVAGSGDTDNASFTIDGNQIKTAASFDRETKSSYSVRVRSTDAGGLSTEQVLTVTIANVNETPTIVALSGNTVAENSAIGSTIGLLNTTDPDVADTFTYTLVAGDGSTDNAAFTISGNQINTATALDFEAKSSYSVRVRSTDAGGLWTEQVFAITVTDVNDAPTAIALSGGTVAENEPVGTLVGLLSTTDQDAGNTFTYTLVSGDGSTDNALFVIDGNQVKTASSLDFEMKPSYSIRVRSTDQGGLWIERVLTVAATNVNETPSAIAVAPTSVAENRPAGTVVGLLSTTDPDAGNTFTYTLVTGSGDSGNASFVIEGNQLKTTASFDYEALSSYSLRVRSTDQGGLWTETVLTITVDNINETPAVVALSGNTVAENSEIGVIVGLLSTTDPDAGDTFTYSLVAGDGSADNAAFTISGNELRAAAAYDFEAKPSYSVRVRSTDAGGLWTEQVFTVTITDVNETPTAIALSGSTVAENEPANTTVGQLSTTDQDAGNTFTYTLVSGTGSTDNASFTIDGDLVKTAASFDYEAKPSYSIRVRATDQGGLFYERVLLISVGNVNEAPSAVLLSSTTVTENAPLGTMVGQLGTTDPDAADTFTYTLVTGTGDTDNAAFTIDGNQIKTAGSFDFETKPSYSIRVRSTDVGGLSAEQTFTITVNDVPNVIALSHASVSENEPAGTVMGTFSMTDPDGETYTYSLAAGDGDDDNASFTIDGGQLKTAASFDFETKASYSVRVRSTDSSNVSTEQVFTITVANVNETPTDVTLAGNTIAENSAIGSTVGQFSTADPDAADTFTYALVTGTGSTDNASFTIDGNQIKTAASFDFETKTNYSIRVRSTDAGGLWTEKVFTVTVTNVNESPTSLALSVAAVSENVPSGTLVGQFSTTDPDAGSTFTYALVPGTGGDDNAAFTIENNLLKTAAAVNYEAKPSYSIRVRTTDQGGLSFDQVMTITVMDVANTVALSNQNVPQDAASGTTIGTLSMTDPEAAIYTYSLVAGQGSDNNGLVVIDGNQLKTAASLDSAQTSLSVRVRSTSFFLASDVVELGGVGGQPYVVQLSYDESLLGTSEQALADAGMLHLGTTVSGTWVNAVTANTAPAGSAAVTNYRGDAPDHNSGSWTNFIAEHSTSSLTDLMGSWGVDTTNNVVWAVMDRAGEFGVQIDLFYEQVFVISVTNTPV